MNNVRNKTKTKVSKATHNSRGFVAVFTVTMVGFLAIIFTVTMMPRSWLGARGVEEMGSGIEAQLEAISCMQFARQHIFSAEHDENQYETGEHFALTGNCVIENIRRSGPKITIETSATKHGIKAVVETILDRESIEIISVEFR